MFDVSFEVHLHADKFEQYLELAQQLKPRLAEIEGFIDNERFASLTRPGWVLSLSSWRDEKSLVRWRSDREHHHVQVQGRARIFGDYKLQIGEVVRDSNVGIDELPHQHRFDETEIGAGNKHSDQLTCRTNCPPQNDRLTSKAALATTMF
jgi:heme-degrading monooxygenase HmoA